MTEVQINVVIQYTDSNHNNKVIEREGYVENKHEAKDLLMAAWRTYKSAKRAEESLDTEESLKQAESEHDYYTLDEYGIPKWI